MAFFYDFEQWKRDHPAADGDRFALNVPRAASNLIDLRNSLDDEAAENLNRVPPKSSFERLLVATWNIQAFGGTRRCEESLWYIAEVLSRFDIIAIQEVKRSLDDLEAVRGLLGPWWKYLVTDVTEGDPGNDERLAYLFDTRKVRFTGMAGEMVLEPIRNDQGILIPARQVVRTPFMAVFRSGWFDFMLATVHLIWGEEQADHPARTAEVREVARFLAKRTEQKGTASRNLILLGDFNIFDQSGNAVQALTEAGFQIPHDRDQLRATNVGKDARFYDQIAYLFAGQQGLKPSAMGVVDFFDSVYSDEKFGEYEQQLRKADGTAPANPLRYYRYSWRRRQMSDHLVLWTELPIEFAGPYLQSRAD